MKTRKNMFIFSLIVFIALTTAIWGLDNDSHTEQKEVEYLSASWPYNYKDIKEISKASDVIALIKVEGTNKSYETQGIPVTEFSVKVIEPIYGTNEEYLTVFMTGREDKNKLIQIKDDPLFQSDEEFLVFCKRNADGTVTILSGPQGRLVYSNGKLNSLHAVNENVKMVNADSNIQIVNADAKMLIEQIDSYVNDK